MAAAPRVSVQENLCAYDNGDYCMRGGVLSVSKSCPFVFSTADPTYRGGRLHLHFAGLARSISSPDPATCTASPCAAPTHVRDTTTTLQLPDSTGHAEADAADVTGPRMLSASCCAKLLESSDTLDSPLQLGHALSSPHLGYENLLASSVSSSLISTQALSTEQRKHGTTLAHSCISAAAALGGYGLTHSLSLETPRDNAPALFSHQITSISYDPAGPSQRTTLDGRGELWNLNSPSGCSSRALGDSILELAEEAVLLRQEGCATRFNMHSLGWRNLA